MIGWQEWHYCGCEDPTTTGSGDKQAIVLDPAKPPRGKNLAAKTLKILTRPHPRAVAGTPLAYDYDAARTTFTLRWTPARASGNGRFRAGAVTEVRIPRRQYPEGYVARATGARVVSKRNAAVLRLAAAKRVDEASVVVSPRS
jgi:endoglycosylceramidase